ncbi:MAG: DUF6531 domain-containing protein, partial [Dehalococcoidia bacterium]
TRHPALVGAGWTVASTGPASGGQDAKGNYLAPVATGGVDLASASVNPGIAVVTSPSYRHYAFSFDIGYTTGYVLQVTWNDTGTSDPNVGKSWVVSSQASNNPTGYTTGDIDIADFMGTQGTFSIHLAGGGKLYSLGDNVAREQMAEPYSQKVGAQIDTSTGAFAFQDHDLDIKGGPLQVTLTRYYNGHSGQFGELGYRWTHTYDIHLWLTGNATGDVTMIWGSGREEFFSHNFQSNTYAPADGREHDTLVANGDGTFSFTATQGNLTYKFSSIGVLTTISDLKGNSITLTYDGNGRLATAKDPGGRTFSFAYNANGTLASVTDPNNGKVSYGYDGTTGDLIAVTDPNGKLRSYTYDRHRLISFTDQNGKTQFSNTLDVVNRVIKQTDVLGKKITIAYGAPSAGITQVTDANNNSAMYYFDIYHRTTDKVDPQGHVTTDLYDSSGNLKKVIDSANDTWVFGYDNVTAQLHRPAGSRRGEEKGWKGSAQPEGLLSSGRYVG